MKLRSEDGFTVAEVVIAAAILFFVLTAIVGLLGNSTEMTVMAKRKSAVVNQVASMIEQVRATPFADIDTVWAGERTYYPDGTDGIRVVVNTVVDTKLDGETPYVKILRIVATGSIDGRSMSYDTRVAIRNPEYGSTLAADPDAPTVEFLDGTPAADSVLVGSQDYGSDGKQSPGSINIYTRSYGPADPIAEVKYEVAGLPFTSTTGGSAVIFPATSNPFEPPATPWNTAQTAVVDGVTVPKYADGFQTLAVTAVDASFRSTTERRRFILDNVPADAPGVPSATALNSCVLSLNWAAARDGGTGTDPIGWYWASQYYYRVYQEPLSGGGSDVTAWGDASIADEGYKLASLTSLARAIQNRGPFTVRSAVDMTSTPALERTARPFSRFFVRVLSGGPTGFDGAKGSTSTSAVVSHPELICDSSAMSTVSISAKLGSSYRYTVSAKVSRPYFPHLPADDGDITYAIKYRRSDGTTAWQDFAPLSRAVTLSDGYVTVTENKLITNANKVAYDFKVDVSGVTPTGLNGGSVLPVISTNIGRMQNSTPAATGSPPLSQNLMAVWE